MLDIAELLVLTNKSGASDLHLTVGVPPMMRVSGTLVKTEYPELTKDDVHELIYSILTDEQKSRYEEKLEIDFSIDVANVARFRVNIYNQRKGDGAAFRIIPSQIKSLAELDLPMAVANLASKHKGLVLVTGPTGSGKSTTLAALIDLLNKERKGHIITIEDPIEFVHEHQNCIVNQREVGPHTESFSMALRSALREDPDIILVGELRDLETISMAITAAETGHLVFATLHTNDCASTVDRIIDVFPAHQQKQIRVQFAASIQGVISQTLIPTPDGNGRVCAVEIMTGTPAVKSLIREGKTHQIHSIIQTSAKDGMQTMDQALKDLLLARKIKKEDALLRALNKDEIKNLKIDTNNTGPTFF